MVRTYKLWQVRVGYTPKIEEKRWLPSMEKEIISLWEKEDIYGIRDGDKRFVIDTPPPYPAPFWHLGAALSYTYQDFIARSRRMMGYSVLYPMGMDGNGLPIEFYLEKYENIDPFSMDREEFVNLCKTTLNKWKEGMKEVMRRFMLSMNDYYETDSDEYRRITQLTFKLLWEKGLIYEDKRPNLWCPKCRTTIAQSEVEYKEMEGKLFVIKYTTTEGEELPVATTRPELLAGCRAVLVHPEDERYKHLHGKKAIVPLYNREVPIIPHPSVDPSFGTGVMHLCSFGDMDDVRLFRELGLKAVNLVDEKGCLTEEAGDELKGLKTEDARKRIVELLRERGLLLEEKSIKHNVPLHERCNTPVEIVSMDELYLKQVEFKDVMREISKKIDIIPERYRNHLLLWIDSISTDWPISRRRFYGTEVPLWTCKRCGYKLVKGGEKYWRPWKEDPGERCPYCGGNEWEGDKRVLDTWMDSSITVLYITGWQRRDDFDKWWKGEKLRPQGYDIIRTWLYYSLLRVYQLTGDAAFNYVYINGMGLDKEGRKMSKRLGNAIDPLESSEKYGADALRLWLAMESSPGENYRINEEKIAGIQKFLTKLWNIARYISSYPYPSQRPELKPTDHWILSELNKLVEDSLKAYEEFRFHEVGRKIYSFTWNTFADHYIEITKRRAKMDGWNEKEAEAAWWTLHTVLKTIILLLAPISPAITDAIWRRLYGETSIHLERFPAPLEGIKDYTAYTEEIKEFNSYVWKKRKELGVKRYEEITIDKEPPEPFREELLKAHYVSTSF